MRSGCQETEPFAKFPPSLARDLRASVGKLWGPGARAPAFSSRQPEASARSAREPRETSRDLPTCLSLEASRASKPTFARLFAASFGGQTESGGPGARAPAFSWLPARSERAVSTRAWRTSRGLPERCSGEASRAREPVRGPGAKPPGQSLEAPPGFEPGMEVLQSRTGPFRPF